MIKVMQLSIVTASFFQCSYMWSGLVY